MNSDSRRFWDLIKANVPESEIGNWVLLAEVHGEGDKTQLRMFTSDLMTPWLAEGIINYGLEIVAQLEEEYEVDDDEYAELDPDDE